MSYIDDFNDKVNSKKIPYDDIPISRNVSQGSSRRNYQKVSISAYKILISLVAILFIANIVLCCTAFYYLRNGKIKYVNVMNDSKIIATEESISVYASNLAYRSSICVAAGGSCSNAETFLNNTLSRGSGVIYKVDRKTNTIYFITCYHV